MSELEEHRSMIARLAKCNGVIEAAGELLINTFSLIVPSVVTVRIQEAHILIGHWWCGVVEGELSVSNNA